MRPFRMPTNEALVVFCVLVVGAVTLGYAAAFVIHPRRSVLRRATGLLALFVAALAFVNPYKYPMWVSGSPHREIWCSHVGDAEDRLMRMLGEMTECASVLDVGAHEGRFTEAAMSVCPRRSCTVWAFEPAPGTFQRLHARSLDPSSPMAHARTFQLALGSRPGRVPFYCAPGPGGCDGVQQNTADAVVAANRGFSEAVLVEATTLDLFVAAHEQIDDICYLKIDTEGLDREVLRGAQNLLGEGAVQLLQWEYLCVVDHSFKSEVSLVDAAGFDVYVLFRAGLMEITPSKGLWDPRVYRLKACVVAIGLHRSWDGRRAFVEKVNGGTSEVFDRAELVEGPLDTFFRFLGSPPCTNAAFEAEQ